MGVMEIVVLVDNFSSRVSSLRDTFVQVYLTADCTPKVHTLSGPSRVSFTTDIYGELALVCILYCRRLHKGVCVTKLLGSAMLDLSEVDSQKKYTVNMYDASVRPSIDMGHIDIQITVPSHAPLYHCLIHNIEFVRALFTAAEANLDLIEGFGKHGLPAVVHGMRLVHSPYYVNHLGVCLPSGAFCMIKTSLSTNHFAALFSHRARLDITLARNGWSEDHFVATVRELCGTTQLGKEHYGCLATVVDFVTLHTRVAMHYMPDVSLHPEAESTERWEVPREPTLDGKQCFVGDCEDYAREVYHQICEIRDWVLPSTESDALEAVSAVLHMYIPTIEQGAVNKNAVSDELRKKIPHAEYRNHIWAAMHPRHHWRTNLDVSKQTRETIGKFFKGLYRKWPKQPCETNLPLLHAEGTADVYPIVLRECPEYILQRQQDPCQTSDFTLQTRGQSNFYKYAIACMTDFFAEFGWLDYTYITEDKYGCNIHEWATSQYRFTPSCTHSSDIMDKIRKAITYDRPIAPIVSMSRIIQNPNISGEFVRCSSKRPIEKGEYYGEYLVDGKPLYENYNRI